MRYADPSHRRNSPASTMSHTQAAGDDGRALNHQRPPSPDKQAVIADLRARIERATRRLKSAGSDAIYEATEADIRQLVTQLEALTAEPVGRVPSVQP